MTNRLFRFALAGLWMMCNSTMAMELHIKGLKLFDFMHLSNVCKAQKGQNLSPAIIWQDVPANAKSLLLLLHDPEATHMSGFVHWVVYISDPAIGFLERAIKPKSSVVFAKNGLGQPRYFGPCPTAGTGVHRYNFTLYALSKRLDPAAVKTMNQSQLINLIYQDVIAQSVFTSIYRNTLDKPSSLS